MATQIEKVLFTGKTHTTAARGDDTRGHGRLDLRLSNNTGGEQVFAAIDAHPTAEQLFAGAWSACYSAALGLVAAQKKVKLPADLAVDIEVDLGQTGAAFFLQARIKVQAPGLPREVAESLAHAADQSCPYSKAVRGNSNVAISVV